MANELELFTTQYSDNLLLNLQQQTSVLRGLTMEGAHKGKMASPVQYLAPVSMRTPGGRLTPIAPISNEYKRRWVTPVDKDLAQYVDTFDELRTLIDPKAQITAGAAAAVAREWDDAIVAAAFGDATLGTDNGSLTTETWASFSGKYEIADTFDDGSTSLGLTVKKLIEANRLFRHFHVTDAELGAGKCLIIGSWQEADLLKQVEVTSDEFAGGMGVVRGPDGGLRRILGWDVRISERLNVSSNVRDCIAFVKSGLYLGVWMDTQNKISQREDLTGHPWQIYTMMSRGATRLEPGRVLKIKCGGDTSGADNI